MQYNTCMWIACSSSIILHPSSLVFYLLNTWPLWSFLIDWPSLTVQWFKDVNKPSDRDVNIHKLLLGTHTSEDETNYLMIADICLPKADAEIVAKAYDDSIKEVGGFGKLDFLPCMHYCIVLYCIVYNDICTYTFICIYEYIFSNAGWGCNYKHISLCMCTSLFFNFEIKTGGVLSKIDCKIKMVHEGEVNKARICPHNQFIIASKVQAKRDICIYNEYTDEKYIYSSILIC